MAASAMYVLRTPKWIIQMQGKARWWNADSWCCQDSRWLSSNPGALPHIKDYSF